MGSIYNLLHCSRDLRETVNITVKQKSFMNSMVAFAGSRTHYHVDGMCS